MQIPTRKVLMSPNICMKITYKVTLKKNCFIANANINFDIFARNIPEKNKGSFTNVMTKFIIIVTVKFTII